MSDLFIGVKPVEERHRIDAARLEDFLKGRIDGLRGPLQVEQFKGGQSNPTYRITAGGKRYALRTKPPGKLLPSAHAVEREFKVITALHRWASPWRSPTSCARTKRDRHGVLRDGLRRGPRAVGPVAARHASPSAARSRTS